MLPQSSTWASTLTLFSLISTITAHTVITYPGWRGNNLHSNGTVEDTNGLGAGGDNSSGLYWPYGMQWSYPCGGMPTSTNRTRWPTTGGAIALQPGWFAGHGKAFIYMNLGLGTIPQNMSHVMVPPFQIVGPTTEPWPGSFCLPQVPLPVNVTVNVGDNATIQVIETAVHGASLYNCVDITFAAPGHPDIVEVTPDNCFNSSDIAFNLVFTTTQLTSGAEVRTGTYSFTITSIVVAGLMAYFLI